MSTAVDRAAVEARALLQRRPMPARALQESLGVSQPTMSRALRMLGDDLVPFGAARSIQYALRDAARSALQAPIFRVTVEGRLQPLGRLVPVRPEGFVMVQADGTRLHTDGLPWWLFDMRPQGYLGRAYHLRHGARLGLPPRLADWSDTHVLRALLQEGDDLPGNLLVGDDARERHLNAPALAPIPLAGRASAYAGLAAATARGEVAGSSAGGEQPKFTAWAELDDGPAHVIVKFSAGADHAVSRRWRSLLAAEHLALQVLRDHGVPAARSAVLDHGAQRFLELRRFDREGERGRRALYSLAALDAEFVGSAGPWPQVARALAEARVVQPDTVPLVDLLWAYGQLIANTDMHGGNLSFLAEGGRPYALAPAYDMTPMAFAPGSGGEMHDRIPPLALGVELPATAWQQALPMAQAWLQRLQALAQADAAFAPCLAALQAHLHDAARRIDRLG